MTDYKYLSIEEENRLYRKIDNLKILSISLVIITIISIFVAIIALSFIDQTRKENQISISEYIDLEEIAYEYNSTQTYYIYRDKNTNTLYLQIEYSGGMTMTPIINPDGTAKLYEGD